MAKKSNKSSSLVYSTETGRLCPACEYPVNECICDDTQKIPDGDGIVRLMLDTKGRKGAGVTLVKGVPVPLDELKTLCKDLKKKCGVGGAIKDHIIEIQGDKRTIIKAELEKRGMKVKLAGG